MHHLAGPVRREKILEFSSMGDYLFRLKEEPKLSLLTQVVLLKSTVLLRAVRIICECKVLQDQDQPWLKKNTVFVNHFAVITM